MRYSRTGIVAMLLAVEVFLGGAILWAFGGSRGWSMPAGGFHRVDQHATAFAPLDAGNAPRVVVDDPDSRIVVTPSTDGKVHVVDGWRTSGWLFDARKSPPLSVKRTGDGVAITRGQGDWHVGFFISDMQQTQVALPPGAALQIEACSGADVSGMNGSIAIQSVDGSIHLDSINATSVKIATSDGSLRMRDVQAPAVDASTSDGSIKATNLRVAGGKLHSDDGGIQLALSDANLTIHAQTGDGSIRFNGRRVEQNDDSGSADYQVGTGAGSLQVSTQDGSIHISTNGAL